MARYPKLDLVGQRFGKLVVLREAPTRLRKDGKKDYFWLCQCDCGQTKEVRGYSLNQGLTRSCGCLHRETSAANGRDNWKGEDASYGAIHKYIRQTKAKTGVCSDCGEMPPHGTEWSNVDHQYSRDPDDYIERCVSCHSKYDLAFNEKRCVLNGEK